MKARLEQWKLRQEARHKDFLRTVFREGELEDHYWSLLGVLTLRTIQCTYDANKSWGESTVLDQKETEQIAARSFKTWCSMNVEYDTKQLDELLAYEAELVKLTDRPLGNNVTVTRPKTDRNQHMTTCNLKQGIKLYRHVVAFSKGLDDMPTVEEFETETSTPPATRREKK